MLILDVILATQLQDLDFIQDSDMQQVLCWTWCGSKPKRDSFCPLIDPCLKDCTSDSQLYLPHIRSIWEALKYVGGPDHIPG